MGFTAKPCRSCSAPVIWATTGTGRDMPVDEQPVPDGSVLLVDQPGGKPLAQVLKVADRFGRTLRTSHFATCPQAGRWRSRRSARRTQTP